MVVRTNEKSTEPLKLDSEVLRYLLQIDLNGKPLAQKKLEEFLFALGYQPKDLSMIIEELRLEDCTEMEKINDRITNVLLQYVVGDK